jgi:hypothetical protein
MLNPNPDWNNLTSAELRAKADILERAAAKLTSESARAEHAEKVKDLRDEADYAEEIENFKTPQVA